MRVKNSDLKLLVFDLSIGSRRRARRSQPLLSNEKGKNYYLCIHRFGNIVQRADLIL
jgi:hypothetical protein